MEDLFQEGKTVYQVKGWKWDQGEYWYRVGLVDTQEEHLVLARERGGNEFTLLDALGKAPLPSVKILEIPACYRKLFISSPLFPALEEIRLQEGSPLTTDGKRMIFSGHTLLACLTKEGDGLIQIPGHVRALGNYCLTQCVCREVSFPPHEISIADHALLGARFLDSPREPVMVGTVLYAVPDAGKELDLGADVRDIFPSAFHSAVPSKISCHSFPSSIPSSFHGELLIKSPQAEIPFSELIGRNTFLTSLTVPEDHDLYRSVDGVLFTRDMETLLYYPPKKQDASYAVPPGTRKIWPRAFSQNCFLESVTLPDGVGQIGASAFLHCRALKRVFLGDGLRLLPDAPTDVEEGVFYGCQSLREVRLPSSLLHIGSQCFCKTGLEQLTLPDGLLSLGDNALWSFGLKEVSLPRSLLRVGRAALLSATQIDAWEGTAQGLMEAFWPIGATSMTGRAFITVDVHRQDGRETRLVFQNPSPRSRLSDILKASWDSGLLTGALYRELLGALGSGLVRSAYLFYLYRHEEGSIREQCLPSLKRVAPSLLESYLKEDDLESFLDLLSEGLLSPQALKKLLQSSDRLGRPQFSAVLLEAMHQSSSTRKTVFPL